LLCGFQPVAGDDYGRTGDDEAGWVHDASAFRGRPRGRAPAAD
jgi:hypothetical protein